MLERAREYLRRHGLEAWRLEAEMLVAHALGLERLQLFLALDRPLVAEEVTRARELLMRRAKREPVAYLIGEREFYGRTFRVGPGVLVPRPETELLVDLAREWARERMFPASGARVLDVGTGSGCLAVTLALELEGAEVDAVDVSAEALAFARDNAKALGANVRFHQLDALRVVPGGSLPVISGGRPFDLVVSNPPYVAVGERADLPADVRDHEPALALFAPAERPDAFAEILVDALVSLLAPGGLMLVELGHDQAARLAGRALPEGARARFARDYGGVQRVWAIERDPA
jgi:release factor glutamine methyltransferase